VTGYRGRNRGDGEELQKVIVTLPKSVLTELDIVVTHYKQEDRSFNRSALIQEALALYLEGLDEK
jgi:metal-responsive CopG/Arc/MetJ family transcriptional regulator